MKRLLRLRTFAARVFRAATLRGLEVLRPLLPERPVVELDAVEVPAKAAASFPEKCEILATIGGVSLTAELAEVHFDADLRSAPDLFAVTGSDAQFMAELRPVLLAATERRQTLTAAFADEDGS